MQSGLSVTDRNIQSITLMSRGAHYQTLSPALTSKGNTEAVHPHIPLIWMWRGFVKIKPFYERHHLSIPNLALNFYQVFVLPGNIFKSEKVLFLLLRQQMLPLEQSENKQGAPPALMAFKVSFESNTPLPGYSTWDAFLFIWMYLYNLESRKLHESGVNTLPGKTTSAGVEPQFCT